MLCRTGFYSNGNISTQRTDLNSLAVYTTLAEWQVHLLLQEYNIGDLISFEGIQQGISNTNYILETTQSRFVLTLIEQPLSTSFPFIFNLMKALSAKGLPCPEIMETEQGSLWSFLSGKPIVLARAMPGASLFSPTCSHCAQLGELLGTLHLAARHFPLQRNNPLGRQWAKTTAANLLPVIAQTEKKTLEAFLPLLLKVSDMNLPTGVIHGDVFRDNIFFEQGVISAVLDFYFACTDMLILDLATSVLDWCQSPDGRFETNKVTALVTAYQKVRPMTPAEIRAWPLMMQVVIARFWLLRLQCKYTPRQTNQMLPFSRSPERMQAMFASTEAFPALTCYAECL
ncbi:MAG TPA: homoserine kinase [Gammaproteobacteria bacterium]|nr:homoserine kinase [Gammaproteobacteria bacterium]